MRSFFHIGRFAAGLVLAVAFAVLSIGVGYAQTVPEPMSPPRLVNDYAGLFSGAQRQQLEDSLVAFDRATSTQIAVVTVNDLDGYPAAEYATRILEKWGVGRKGKDNGVVMLLKPRNQYGGGEVFIAVGYGLEGALPDITAGRIIDSEMIPYLAQTRPDYYGAAVAGSAAVRAAVRGEYTASGSDRRGGDAFDWIGGLFSLGVIIFILVILGKSYKGGDEEGGDDGSGGGSGNNGRRSYRQGPLIFPPIIGGFGGGGFGGGGFGGFGGGMGGGGGAGRSF